MQQHIDIFGGLGNQMFQYAFYLSKKEMGYNVIPDISLFRTDKRHLMHNGFELAKIFNLNSSVVFHSSFFSQYLIKLALKLKLRFLISNDSVSLGYRENLKFSKLYHLHGYWQSEKYFNDITDLVRKEFVFKDVDQINLTLSREMNDDSEYTSISLHIRRGDYINYNMKLLGRAYYEKAIDYIKSKVENPKFYIFSDDMSAAIKIVKGMGVTYTPISINTGIDSYKDMFLMSQCKNNIIANSSFSWWGAWLNANKKKMVIAPSWGKDFNCKDWIIIGD